MLLKRKRPDTLPSLSSTQQADPPMQLMIFEKRVIHFSRFHHLLSQCLSQLVNCLEYSEDWVCLGREQFPD